MMETKLTSSLQVQRKWIWGLFALYFLAVLVLLVYHEPWEDELQVWCVARDLSLPEIIYQMRYEGHFALWYLLVKPFTACGSVILQNYVSCLLVSASVALFLSSRQFRWDFKIALLLSCPILYWFPVVARCYALIPLALCLLAAVYPVRFKRPFVYALALILLVHTHAYMEGFAGILGFTFAWELLRRSRRIGGRQLWTAVGLFLLLGFGVAAAFLQVAPALDVSSFAPETAGSNWTDLSSVPARIWDALMKLPVGFAESSSKYLGKYPVIVLFYICLVAAVVQLFLTRRQAGVFFLAGFLWQILFAALLYPMGLHRVYLPLLMLVFCFALPMRKKAVRDLNPHMKKLLTGMIPVTILALMTLPDTLHFAVSDLEKPFSNQWLAARLIESELPENAKIVVFPDDLITGTFRAYLPDRFFYRCSDGQPFRIFRTGRKMPEKLDPDLLNQYLDSEKEVYLLFQIGVFIDCQLPLDRNQFVLGDYFFDAVFVTAPISFFSAGEDYVVFRVTRIKDTVSSVFSQSAFSRCDKRTSEPIGA